MSKARNKLPAKYIFGIIILIIIAVYFLGSVYIPIKSLSSAQISYSKLKITTPVSQYPWPNYGESAVGLANGQVTAWSGAQVPRPTASVAKLIAALAVVKKYPLKLNQPGPNITITNQDYTIYSNYIAGQGSVVPVYAGEVLTEYQMLSAMLVPSGDNIADSLVIWAYGSLSNYQKYANSTLLPELGLNYTHVGSDASGYSPTTTTTAKDMIKLGSYILNNSVLSQIVSQKTVNVPNVGIMYNYDNILGTDGIIGIKTGNSNQAGGVFLGAANTLVNGRNVQVLTAVMDAPSLIQSLQNSISLIVAARNNFEESTIINNNESLGEFVLPWGGYVDLIAKSNIYQEVISGQTTIAYLHLNHLKIPSPAGTIVGYLTIPANQLNNAVNIPIYTKQAATKPSLEWRLLHPNYLIKYL